MTDRVFVTPEQAKAVLNRDYHIRQQMGPMLMGSDISEESIHGIIDKAYTIEISGGIARGIGDGLVAFVLNEDKKTGKYIFLATIEEKLAALEAELIAAGKELEAIPADMKLAD